MEIVVSIEPLAQGGFRAWAGEPLNLCVEGPTMAEATRQLATLVDAMMAQGRLLTTLTVVNGKVVNAPAPSIPADNLYQTDWAFQELQEAIAENRRQEQAANP